MKSEAVKEVLDVLFSHLEKLETQTEAISRFLKEKKKVTDAQLAPYLEQAGKASNVRWRAARVRIDYLIEGAERENEKERAAESEKKPEPAVKTAEKSDEKRDVKKDDSAPATPGPWGHETPIETKSDSGKSAETKNKPEVEQEDAHPVKRENKDDTPAVAQNEHKDPANAEKEHKGQEAA